MSAIIPFEETLRLKRVQRKDVIEVQQKAATFDSTSQYLHGPQVGGFGGLLNQPGADPRVISAIQGPLMIADLIPVYPDQNAQPIYEMLIAAADDNGSEAADLATRSKTVGRLKAFRHTAPFGRIIRSTDTMSPDKLGRYVNRGEPMDLQMINGIAGSSPWIPEAAKDLSLTDEVRTDWWSIGLSLRRKIEVMTFQGAGTNVMTNQGYIEFYGLDTLINTGKADALTGNTVNGADSKVVAWNAAFDASATVETESMDLVECFSRTHYYLMARADATELQPMNIVLAMRRDLFVKLVNFWPYTYLTTGPAASSSKPIQLDAGDMTAMRDSMRQRQYLTINGVDIPVVFSDGIRETITATGVKSDIYWITLAAGGLRTLYYQYFDYSNQMVATLLSRFPNGEMVVTDAGRMLWTFDRTNYVAYFQCLVEPRLVLRTAFLCARITGVQYKTAIHSISGIPGDVYDQLAVADGGVTSSGYGSAIYNANV